MTKVTQLFKQFDKTPVTHYFSPAEINALITIGKVRNEPTDFFKEIYEVTQYLQNLYHTGNLDILENDIQIGLNTSWDKSELYPLIKIKPVPQEYHYTQNDLFYHIQNEFQIKRDNLPKLLHSLYINQFISCFNQSPSGSFLTFPNRKEIQKVAMSSDNKTSLNLLQYQTITGFSDTEIVGLKNH